MRIGFFFLLFCLGHSAWGSSDDSLIIKKDLRPEWTYYSKNEYIIVEDIREQHTSIYIQIDPLTTPNHYLLINSEQLLDIFIDGKLASTSVNSKVIPLDSLSRLLFGKEFQVAIHSKEILELSKLNTTLILKEPKQKESIGDLTVEPRISTSFRDYVIVALVILFMYWVVSIRVSPRLFADYFSISKLFFARETDDYQYFRITSATILFYGFSCLALSLIFIIINYYYDLPIINGMHENASFPYLMWQWFLLSAILFIALIVKILVLILLANVFGIGELVGYQFFNFMRLLLLVVVLLLVIISSYYLLHGDEPNTYQISYSVLGWIMFFWVGLIFFKLHSRVPFSSIHLFLYICATEIIPFLVTVKILYK